MEATANTGYIISPFPNLVNSSDFKSDFAWGAATSAYQIEGASNEGGRGASIWDVYAKDHAHDPIVKVDNTKSGTDAYFKTKVDVRLMKKMGINSYRFSVSWSRIFPGGRLDKGLNVEGVDYYNTLINELISNGIEPYITLFHWDTPQALEDEYMGFLDEQIIYDFLSYAEFCFWEFGDRVKNWITVNEPFSYAVMGYATGAYPPGRGQNGVGDAGTEPYIVGHNLLLCHAAAVRLFRQRFQGCQGGRIGIANNSMFCEPLNPDSQEDRDAAVRAIDFMFGWFVEPLFSGKYPETMIKNVGDRLPKFTEEQAQLVKGSYDFIGLNYYCAVYATTTTPSQGPPSYLTDSMVQSQPVDVNGKPIGIKGGPSWLHSYPLGFYKLLMHIKFTYGNPVIIITENGWGEINDHELDIEEACADTERINYHHSHLQNLRDAVRDGVRVDGYFAWSLMDNFEWDSGYSIRFGLFYINYKNGKNTRYPKNSAIWYKNFLQNQEKLADKKYHIA